PASAGTIALRRFSRGARRTSPVYERTAENAQAQDGTGNSGRFNGVARNSAARRRTGPQIREPAGGIRKGMGAEERYAATARVPGISRIFSAGERQHFARRRRSRRRGAAHDRSRGQGAGVRARVRASGEQPGVSGQRPFAAVRLSAGVDEGRASRGGLPYSGRAPALL